MGVPVHNYICTVLIIVFKIILAQDPWGTYRNYQWTPQYDQPKPTYRNYPPQVVAPLPPPPPPIPSYSPQPFIPPPKPIALAAKPATPPAMAAAIPAKPATTMTSVPEAFKPPDPEIVPTQDPESLKTNLGIKTTNGLDSTVLNNLAIALQLLIVSNILKSPPPESVSVSSPEASPTPLLPVQIQPNLLNSYNQYYDIVKEPIPVQNQLYYPQNTFENQLNKLPFSNMNFLGSSNFLDPGDSMLRSYVPTSTSKSRSSYSLMSPYEALPPEPLSYPPGFELAAMGSLGSFKDFESPYAALSSYGDIFSF